jgi:hypothetical protein
LNSASQSLVILLTSENKGREPQRARARLLASIPQHFGFDRENATLAAPQSHDDDFYESVAFGFKFTIALTAKWANGLVAMIVSLQSRLVNSGNAIKAVVAFTANFVALTVARLIVRSVNVRAKQNADRLHVSFACDPTALFASQRHERLATFTPTQNGKRERTAIGTLSDNAIVEPRNLDRPTATVTLCRTCNDSATKEFDRNGFRVTVRAL